MTSVEEVATVAGSRIAEKLAEKAIEAVTLKETDGHVIIYFGIHFERAQNRDILGQIEAMIKDLCRKGYDKRNRVCTTGNEQKYLVTIETTTVLDIVIDSTIVREEELENLKEIGISEADLDRITDITLRVEPLERAALENLYEIARRLFDYVNMYLRETLSCKIVIESEKQNIIESYREKARRLKLKNIVTRNGRRITIILTASQIPDKEIYKALFEKENILTRWIKRLRFLLL